MPLAPEVDDWLGRRTYDGRVPVDVEGLPRSAVLLVPALDEEATVGAVVSAALDDPGCRALLTEVVVVDGGSTDDTVRVARAAGARVVDARTVAPQLPQGGKGGAVWRGLLVSEGTHVVVVDADLEPFDPSWVVALLAPLLRDPSLHLVKAAWDRPLVVGGVAHPGAGGRVTELLARPLLAALWPELAGVVQPLSGELAARRDLLEALPVATGYGLEIGMLVDALAAVGLDGLGQVDLGERRHRHQGDRALGRMASAVLRTALARRGLPDLPDGLVQWGREAERLRPLVTDTPLQDLPPAASQR